MKAAICGVICALVATVDTGFALAQWSAQPSGTGTRLRGVHAVNQSVVWVSGNNGTFGRTTDAGVTWNEVPRENIPAAHPGEAAFAASGTCVSVFGADHAWIGTGGSASRVLRSTDRGRTWSAARTPIASGTPSSEVYSIAFSNPLNGVIVGGDYLKERESSVNFARTTDGGQTWIPGPSLPGYRSAVSYVFREGRVGLVAVGPSGSDYLAPAANSWTSIDSAGYHATSFLPSLATGWSVGESGSIARWFETLP